MSSATDRGSTLKKYLEEHKEEAKRICVRTAEKILRNSRISAFEGCRDTSFTASSNSGYVNVQLGEKDEPITKVLLHHLMSWYYRREAYGHTFESIPASGDDTRLSITHRCGNVLCVSDHFHPEPLNYNKTRQLCILVKRNVFCSTTTTPRSSIVPTSPSVSALARMVISWQMQLRQLPPQRRNARSIQFDCLANVTSFCQYNSAVLETF